MTTQAMTPKQLGYSMPAEWEPHQATWLSWPHKEESWPGMLHKIQPVYAQMVAALARSETVHINVNDAAMEQAARTLLKNAGAAGDIRFHHFPTNDAWCRDHGAVFVTRVEGRRSRESRVESPEPESTNPQSAIGAPARAGHRQFSGSRLSTLDSRLVAVDWDYNAWGNKYPPYDLDDRIPELMAKCLGVPRFQGRMVLEGGSIDVNGKGLLLTTEACLLNPNRNPNLSRDEIEQRLYDFLGVERVLWLADGIAGDDTDGHIDDITRFVAADTVVTAVEDDRSDENYAALQRNRERLESMRDLEGRPLRIVDLPMPPPIVYEGQRLPASYANFYIANKVILLPGFNDPRDDKARKVLAELFPERHVVQIDCTELVWGLGAFHCLTQQVPA